MVGWFEIPVTSMERAKSFYETVFEVAISVHDLGGLVMGWFPSGDNTHGATGSLVQHEMYQPSESHGVLIYFSSRDVNIELNRVASAGGTVLKPKTAIGEGHGFMALLKDSEGNRIALHSQQ